MSIHQTASTIYRDATFAARELSVDALQSHQDALSASLAADDSEFSNDVTRFRDGERYRAVSDELARRERLHQIGKEVPSINDARYRAWRDLAQTVRERVDMIDVLTDAGVHMVKAGRNGRRRCNEFHGACPVCGGEDRFVAWDGPNGRAWCRQCEWGGDIVTVAMSLIPACREFRDCIRYLADRAVVMSRVRA